MECKFCFRIKQTICFEEFEEIVKKKFGAGWRCDCAVISAVELHLYSLRLEDVFSTVSYCVFERLPFWRLNTSNEALSGCVVFVHLPLVVVFS
jgi:hypothetical protein